VTKTTLARARPERFIRRLFAHIRLEISVCLDFSTFDIRHSAAKAASLLLFI